jgi:hypothetical protein
VVDKATRYSEWVPGRGSIAEDYWICEGCKKEFETQILAEKHEKSCDRLLLKEAEARARARAKAGRKETVVPSVTDAKVSSLSATEVPRHANGGGASGFIFFIGVVLLVGALFFPTESPTVECGVPPIAPEEMQDWQDCMESMKSQLTVMKWMNGLGLIFCLVGIYNKIR